MAVVHTRSQEKPAVGMKSIGAELRDDQGNPINPATEDTLANVATEDTLNKLRVVSSAEINTSLQAVIKELKKINMQLSEMTDWEIQNKEVE